MHPYTRKRVVLTEKFLPLCSIVSLVSAPAFADLIVSSTPGAGFIAGVTPTASGNGGFIGAANQSPKPYWDHQSLDANGNATVMSAIS
jgi:hypothetical protein